MKCLSVSPTITALLVLGLSGNLAFADEQSCKALIQAHSTQAQILQAQYIASGAAQKDPMAAMTGAAVADVTLPGHCLVQGIIEKRTGVDDKPYGINFEVRLPDDWQNRLLFQGGGGLDGFLANALGRIPVQTSSAKPALTRGYAVVSMDGGHQGLDASFGYDQQARLDYAYAAIGKVWSEAKRMTEMYYQKPPKYTYFMGCSNGGREAMIAAQRYPTEFNGIVAGNPGFRLSYANLAEAWDTQAFMSIAPKDSQGRPILAQAFSPEDLKIVSDSVAQTCDALDGLEDGLINNYRACNFDPKALQCTASKNASCLSAEQVAVLHKVFEGPKNSLGQALYSSWPYDIGIAANGWRLWKLGFSDDATKPDALNLVLGADSLKNYFMTPANNNFDVLKFDFDKDAHRIRQTSAVHDAASTYMTTFKAHGGKMLIYHGLSDPVFSADDLMNWYEELQRDTDGGNTTQTQQWARLFMVPGMTHCGNGPGLNDFDPLMAIENWAENKQAPDMLPAKGKEFPDKAQPLCPYPQYTKYQSGDSNDIKSYSCALSN